MTEVFIFQKRRSSFIHLNRSVFSDLKHKIKGKGKEGTFSSLPQVHLKIRLCFPLPYCVSNFVFRVYPSSPVHPLLLKNLTDSITKARENIEALEAEEEAGKHGKLKVTLFSTCCTSLGVLLVFKHFFNFPQKLPFSKEDVRHLKGEISHVFML